MLVLIDSLVHPSQRQEQYNVLFVSRRTALGDQWLKIVQT